MIEDLVDAIEAFALATVRHHEGGYIMPPIEERKALVLALRSWARSRA